MWTKSLNASNILFRFPAAEECCTESITLDDSNPKAYFIRAKARAKMGKLELAVTGNNILRNLCQ